MTDPRPLRSPLPARLHCTANPPGFIYTVAACAKSAPGSPCPKSRQLVGTLPELLHHGVQDLILLRGQTFERHPEGVERLGPLRPADPPHLPGEQRVRRGAREADLDD